MSDKLTTAPWPYGPNHRVVLGWKSLVVGILISDIAFFLLPGIMSASRSPQHSAYQLSLLPIVIVVGAFPVSVVGVPAAMLVGKALRGVRNQWVHVAAFSAAGALVGTLAGVSFTGWTTHTLVHMSLPAALAAAIGRLSVWKLVHVRPEHCVPLPRSGNTTAGPSPYGSEN